MGVVAYLGSALWIWGFWRNIGAWTQMVVWCVLGLFLISPRIVKLLWARHLASLRWTSSFSAYLIVNHGYFPMSLFFTSLYLCLHNIHCVTQLSNLISLLLWWDVCAVSHNCDDFPSSSPLILNVIFRWYLSTVYYLWQYQNVSLCEMF